jgi:prepilin-type processing-associated H-X9-DG protein/prepilin-type N-terminal cleavage/methylation domain-containing protein
MSSKGKNGGLGPSLSEAAGFSLLELLVVTAIVVILAALMLPALSDAKAKAGSTTCASRLRQIGLALTMYTSESQRYPPLADRRSPDLCFHKLYPYYPVRCTNASWNCPIYVANKGILSESLVRSNSVGISYAYNDVGIVSGWPDCPRSIFALQLGLGHLPMDSKKDLAVAAPSEMYAVADARAETFGRGIAGGIKMSVWLFDAYSYFTGAETPPPHAQGYNMLFCDGHVALVKRRDYLYPPRSATHWNSDNQPHPEAWAPTNLWAVQQ